MSKENIVFLTGGSAGLGKATAELLMQNGYTVYSASRRLAERQEDILPLAQHFLSQMCARYGKRITQISAPAATRSCSTIRRAFYRQAFAQAKATTLLS